jgi:peptidoglycan/LPS O-acetylase OafA/YrhL
LAISTNAARGEFFRPTCCFSVLACSCMELGGFAPGYLYAFLMNFIYPLRVSAPLPFAPLWSLAVEEQFYLLWPLAVYFLSEKHLARLALSLIVAAPILRWICTPWFATQWQIYMLTPFRMDTLATGALIAIAWRRHRDRSERYGHYGLILQRLLYPL